MLNNSLQILSFIIVQMYKWRFYIYKNMWEIGVLMISISTKYIRKTLTFSSLNDSLKIESLKLSVSWMIYSLVASHSDLLKVP